MKIRDKLSIQFTVLAASILLLFCIMIYYTSMIQLRTYFYKQLYERATTTAYTYLEEDALSPEVYEKVRERYVRTLPQEVAQLFDPDNKPRFTKPVAEVAYDAETINYIRSNHTFPSYYEFRKGKVQSVGMFYPDNQGDFVVIVSAVDTVGRSHLNNLAWILATGFCLSLIVLFMTGRIFATQALKPIPKIVNQVNNISASSLYIRLDQGKEEDEISELVATFNSLLGRLEENFNMQQRFVANASHELRTPLTSIIGEIEVALGKTRTSAEHEEILHSVHKDALTLHELISGLLDMAQAESKKLNKLLHPIRVDELVLEASMQMEKKYPDSVINVNYALTNGQDADFMLPATRSLLLNAFINLIENAIKFSADNPSVDITLTATADTIEIRLQDYGIGISKDEIDKIFDPFYRSEAVIAKSGYGIGLSLVKRILSLLNGDIQVASEVGKGSVFTVSFRK